MIQKNSYLIAGHALGSLRQAKKSIFDSELVTDVSISVNNKSFPLAVTGTATVPSFHMLYTVILFDIFI